MQRRQVESPRAAVMRAAMQHPLAPEGWEPAESADIHRRLPVAVYSSAVRALVMEPGLVSVPSMVPEPRLVSAPAYGRVQASALVRDAARGSLRETPLSLPLASSVSNRRWQLAE
jgi:hypothetical protein